MVIDIQSIQNGLLVMAIGYLKQILMICFRKRKNDFDRAVLSKLRLEILQNKIKVTSMYIFIVESHI